MTAIATAPQMAIAGQPDLSALPDHGDFKTRKHPVEFFAPPPPEIGIVTSADSTLRLGKSHKSMAARLILAGIIGGAIAGFFFFLAHQADMPSDGQGLIIAGCVLGSIAFLCTLFVTRFYATCTYVGELGAAKFVLKGSRDAEPKTYMVLFPAATELFTSMTRHTTNGVYSGTSYSFYWNDAEGKRLMSLSGRHRGNKKLPKQGDAFHFARAAEIAWSVHYLARVQKTLEDEGSIPFRQGKNRWIRVGAGFLEFHGFTPEPVKVTKDEIASCTLGAGRFSFKHKDAKWYSNSGKFTFDYGRMANAKVFLLALDRLMGYRWN